MTGTNDLSSCDKKVKKLEAVISQGFLVSEKNSTRGSLFLRIIFNFLLRLGPDWREI
jgi:hypothetical protein